MKKNNLKDAALTLLLLLCSSVLVIVYFLFTRENLQFNAIESGKMVNISIGNDVAYDSSLSSSHEIQELKK